MSRVINLDSTGKRRNQLRRTIAELLRHACQKPAFDEDARDMLAMIVFCLQEMGDGIEQSARAWEGRNYWVKAEELRQRWRWVHQDAERLRRLLYQDEPGQLPEVMASLLPHFSDLRIKRSMRKPDLWRGSYRRLLQEGAPGGGGKR